MTRALAVKDAVMFMDGFGVVLSVNSAQGLALIRMASGADHEVRIEIATAAREFLNQFAMKQAS